MTLYPVGGVRSHDPWKLTIAVEFQLHGKEPHSLVEVELEQDWVDGG